MDNFGSLLAGSRGGCNDEAVILAREFLRERPRFRTELFASDNTAGVFCTFAERDKAREQSPEQRDSASSLPFWVAASKIACARFANAPSTPPMAS